MLILITLAWDKQLWSLPYHSTNSAPSSICVSHVPLFPFPFYFIFYYHTKISAFLGVFFNIHFLLNLLHLTGLLQVYLLLPLLKSFYPQYSSFCFHVEYFLLPLLLLSLSQLIFLLSHFIVPFHLPDLYAHYLHKNKTTKQNTQVN